MSHRSDTVHLPCGQMRGQCLGNQGIHTQPVEVMLHFKLTVEKHMVQLVTMRQQQDLVPEEQRRHPATGEQEALLDGLMYQLVNLLQSGAAGGLGLQPSCPSLDVRGVVGGGQRAQSSRQPDQPVHQRNDPEATFVSQHLSNRGIDISALFQASFQDYKLYQGDKYDEDKNTLFHEVDAIVTLARREWAQKQGDNAKKVKSCVWVLPTPPPRAFPQSLLLPTRSHCGHCDHSAKRYVVNGHLLFLGTNGVRYLHWTLKNHCVLQEREGASHGSATGRDGHAAGPGVRQGFINLGISENKLCLDLMTERLSQSDMNVIEDVLLQYPDWSGQPFLWEEVARFLTYYCKAPAQLDPENVVVLNGCCSVFSTLAVVLCDPGEAFLTPTPFYGGFAFSSHLYSKVELILVHLDSESTDAHPRLFQLTVDKLDRLCLRRHLQGLILINPQNPLGDVYSRDSLKEYLEFAKRYNLHVIIDEIYMLSVFDESITFHSLLGMESLPDPNRTHVIWGTSKDFGISGFCFGVLYTQNKKVASAVSSFGYRHGISGIAQYKLYRLLRDREWIDRVYLPTYCSRLQRAHRYITKKLKALGISFLNHGSGLYVWINLKVYLDLWTFEEERLLHRRFLDNKLILSRGKTYMCKEPGWIRVVFADKPLRLKQAMHRFYQVLETQKLELRVKQLESAQCE